MRENVARTKEGPAFYQIQEAKKRREEDGTPGGGASQDKGWVLA